MIKLIYSIFHLVYVISEATRNSIRGRKFQNFPRLACPQTPLVWVCYCTLEFPPPLYQKILNPCSRPLPVIILRFIIEDNKSQHSKYKRRHAGRGIAGQTVYYRDVIVMTTSAIINALWQIYWSREKHYHPQILSVHAYRGNNTMSSYSLTNMD